MTAAMSGVPSSHDGHRLITFSGILYMIGGYTNDPVRGWEYSNAMWAADLAGFFGSVNNGPGDPNANLQWYKVQPLNAPGVFSPRGGFSLNVYSATIFLFGGLKHDLPPNFDPTGKPDPICANAGSNCVVFNDLWMYQPGLIQQPLDVNLCSNSTCGWSLVSVTGNTLPPPRYGHASGVLADNLYICGGVDANGNFLTDLWVFNIEDGFWTPATSTFRGMSALPTPQTFFPSMSFVGHNAYVEMTGDAGGHAIYRWVPEAPPRSGGNNNGGSGDYAAISSGHTAGIVIGILVGIGNLALLAILFARTGGISKLLGTGGPSIPSAAYSNSLDLNI